MNTFTVIDEPESSQMAMHQNENANWVDAEDALAEAGAEVCGARSVTTDKYKNLYAITPVTLPASDDEPERIGLLIEDLNQTASE